MGDGLPLLVSLLAVAMGLNLLEVVQLPLPSFLADVDVREAGGGRLPASAKAYLAGLTFALAASPCSTPVLATLLGYVATTGDPLRGSTLLLTYTRRGAGGPGRGRPPAFSHAPLAQRLRLPAAAGRVRHGRAERDDGAAAV